MIYLAGSIWGLTPGEASGWRELAKGLLPDLELFDPLDLEFDAKTEDPQKIVAMDLATIDKCELLLVNVMYPSWGTGMEIHYAWQQGKTIIAFGSDGHISPWVRFHVTHLFKDFDRAIDWIKGYV